MKRQLLAVLLVSSLVLAATAGPVAAQSQSPYDGKVSPKAAQIDSLIGFSVPSDVVEYDGRPGYFITYEEGKLDSLESWANGSTDYEIISRDNDSNRALVAAPPFAVHGGFGFVEAEVAGFQFSRPSIGTGLVSASYVKFVDVNFRVSYVDPIDELQNESGWSPPVPSAAVRGSWSTDGVAFDGDADEKNMTEAGDLIGADNVSETGNGVTIAVIDTGANVGSGEIYGNGTSNSNIRISEAKNFITNETVNTSAGSPDWSVVSDRNGHGSWVASAAAANVTGTEHDGIAPDADLLVAKALDSDGQGDIADIVDAVEWSEDNGADIIVMSLGSPIYSPVLADQLEESVGNGSVTVAVVAAGNSRQTVRYVASPADAPTDGVVAVAATNVANNTTSAMSAYFSSVGPDPARDLSNGVTLGQGPDVAAPGMNVSAAVLTSTSGVRQNVTMSGTSMATPIVGGGFALALEANSEWVNETDVAGWAENTSRRMPQAGVTEVGSGMFAVDHLVDKDSNETTQSDVRNADAESRDVANEAFGSNPALQFLAGARDRVTGLAS